MRLDRRGLAAGLGAFVIWGFLTVYWKALRDFDAVELIGHRVVWSSLLLAAVIALTHRFAKLANALRSPALIGRLALASVLLAGNWTSYVYAVVTGRVVESALGYFISPIGLMLVGVIALGERLRPVQWLALGCSCVAVAVLAVAYGEIPWLALAMASTWCAYGYLKKQVPLGPLESLAGETWILFVPALIFVITRHVSGDGVASTGTTTQIVLVLFTGAATAIPLVLFATAAKRLPLTVIGPMQYIVPTINFLLGVLVYHEPMGPARLAGFALVWVALALIAFEGLWERRRASAGLASVS